MPNVTVTQVEELESAHRRSAAFVRTTVLRVFSLVIAACSGDPGDTTPVAPVDSTPPAAWACEARAYKDGVVCHCECGAPDPDCANPALIVTGCVNNEVCAPSGTCTSCGNGHIDGGERCDSALPATAECGPLGYAPGQVPCSSSCDWAYDRCMPLATCGNGKLDSGELCDGALIRPDLDCTDYGRTSGMLACGANCQIIASGCSLCGDGNVEGSETCDDRDATGGDGCSSACTIEAGWQCSGRPSSCTPKCGDGILVGKEACDDGNSASNDGCSATCQIEVDCTCSGTPSMCRCATTQLITSTTERIQTGALALDAAGSPHASWLYGVNYTDPVTSTSMMHTYAMYAERPSTTWSTSQIQTWDQIQTGLGPNDFRLAYDGGLVRAFFHRIYVTAGTFAVATRSGASWSLSYGKPTYSYDTIRGGGDWHAIVAGTSLGDTRYLMGTPGTWTRDEALTGFNTNEALRLAYATNGDVYIASMTRGTRNTSYNMKLAKRTGTSTWSTVYDVATTGTCVYPVAHEPLALAMDEVMSFEDGFDGAGHRWLRAHRVAGSSWAVEDVADLSWLNKSCSTGGASWRTLPTVTAADQLGQPHILYPSKPDASNKTLTFEDHYRDATGWHVRTFPITNGTPLDMKIDTAGTTHILALAPSTPASTTRILYIRITQMAW